MTPEDFTAGIENWCSHLRFLWMALNATTGPIMELGMGDGSTPRLSRFSAATGRKVFSFDNNREWTNRFRGSASDLHIITDIADYSSAPIEDRSWSVVLVDHAPGERRWIELDRLSKNPNVDYVVVHDAEPQSVGYGLSASWPNWKSVRLDRRFSAWTAIASNKHDVNALRFPLDKATDPVDFPAAVILPSGLMNEWQRVDQKTGMVQPWFTHPSLDEIQTWDVKGKSILEWGGGLSTLWWGERVGGHGRVHTIEHTDHPGWWSWLIGATEHINHVTLKKSTGNAYFKAPKGPWDVVIVDGSMCHLRGECLKKAVAMPRPLTIIVDNWQQDDVWIDEAAAELMAPYSDYVKFYVQPNHTAHRGRPWRTAIWKLP